MQCDQGDNPLGARLIARVSWRQRRQLLPHPGTLLALQETRFGRPRHCPDLYANARVASQVEEPRGVDVEAAVGGHYDVAPSILECPQRDCTLFSRLPTLGRQQQHAYAQDPSSDPPPRQSVQEDVDSIEETEDSFGHSPLLDRPDAGRVNERIASLAAPKPGRRTVAG